MTPTGADAALATTSDVALVAALRAIDGRALGEVHRRYASALLAFALALVTDRARAEEVVQEVFLQLWRAPEKFDPGRGTLRQYLLAQTHGRSLDLVRSEASRRRREERDAVRPDSSPYELEREVEQSMTAAQIRALLSRLPEDERRAIELAYLNGHSYSETALLLGHPTGTVKSRIRSGLRRLREAMERHGVGAAG